MSENLTSFFMMVSRTYITLSRKSMKLVIEKV